MNFNSIKLFFSSYSVHSVVIALTVATVKLVVERFFLKKTKVNLTVISILITVILDFSYSMIFIEKGFVLSENILYSAMLSGGLTTIISSVVRRVLAGKKIILDKTVLFLEELLSSYDFCFSDNGKTAEKIKSILEDNDKIATEKEEEISETLRENIVCISELEICSVTKIIMENAKEENNGN